jgi:hypothetical protein
VLAVVLAALTAGACGDGEPREATLEQLTWETDAYVDRDVEVTGIVREFGEAEGATVHHYVIEDARHNRVQLLPNEAAAPHVGNEVTVVGRFEFSDTEGRRLHVDTVRPANG